MIEVLRSKKVVLPAVMLSFGAVACGNKVAPRSSPDNTCQQLARQITPSLKQQILHNTASISFTQPLKNPELQTMVFGFPISLSTQEFNEDQVVIRDIHALVDPQLTISITEGKSAAVPEGSLGIALFYGNCNPISSMASTVQTT